MSERDAVPNVQHRVILRSGEPWPLADSVKNRHAHLTRSTSASLAEHLPNLVSLSEKRPDLVFKVSEPGA